MTPSFGDSLLPESLAHLSDVALEGATTPISVAVAVPPSPEAEKEAREAEAKRVFAKLLATEVPPRPRPALLADCLARYRHDPKKRAAADAAEELARTGEIREANATKHAMLLTGSFGVGKTWLATAVWKTLAWQAVKQNPTSGARGLVWTTFDDFVLDIQDTYHPSSERTKMQALGRYRNAPLLLLDDVGDLDDESPESTDRRRSLYTLLNHRSNWLLPTLLTSNLGPKDLQAAFGGRSIQRVIEMCALVGMEGANLRLDT